MHPPALVANSTSTCCSCQSVPAFAATRRCSCTTQAREKEEISAVEGSICPGCPSGVEQIEWTACTRAPATAHRTPAQHVRATLTAEAVRGSADGGGGAGGADGRFAPHGSIGHAGTATMRTRMPRGCRARGQRATERGALRRLRRGPAILPVTALRASSKERQPYSNRCITSAGNTSQYLSRSYRVVKIFFALVDYSSFDAGALICLYKVPCHLLNPQATSKRQSGQTKVRANVPFYAHAITIASIAMCTYPRER